MQKLQRTSVGMSTSEYEKMQWVANRHHVSFPWIGRQTIDELLFHYGASDNKVPLHLQIAKSIEE